MTTAGILELVAALALIALGIWQYRRRDGSRRRDTQGAVLLMLVGAIVAMHALGAFEYRPSAAELEQATAP